MLNIVLFGAPGSGKGTQSENLIEHYKLFHISTGDVLRDHIKRGYSKGLIYLRKPDDADGLYYKFCIHHSILRGNVPHDEGYDRQKRIQHITDKGVRL